VNGTGFMILDSGQLDDLVDAVCDPTISLYSPGRRPGEDWRKDPIRLKNLLGDCERQLEERGFKGPERRRLLEPARRLIDDEFFWHRGSPGLAVFLDGSQERVYRLPYRVELLAIVDRRPYVSPLLPLLAAGGRYYLLALSRNSVRLFEGADGALIRLELEGLPASLVEALGAEVDEPSLQYHSAQGSTGSAQGGSGGGSAPSPVYHGQGYGQDDRVEELDRFLRAVWRPLAKFLADKRTPLLVATVDRVFSQLQQVAPEPYLLEQHVSGNPDDLDEHQLGQRAAPIIEAVFRQQLEAALQRLEEEAGRRLDDIAAILRAADEGRIDTLFLARDSHVWGLVDGAGSPALVHDQRHDDDRDLLDVAAARTLRKAGTVFVVERERLSGGGPALALTRY
jgi:hypothetical protein